MLETPQMNATCKSKIILIAIAISLPITGAYAGEPKPYEMPRSQVVSLKDTAFDRQYEIYVKLPDGYSENPDELYPVIYTTDAKWHIEMLSAATEYLMPNVVVVGISWQTDLGEEAEHFSRFRDYSLIESTNSERQARYQFGQAQNHLAFIRDEVMEFVDQNYRTAPGDNTYFGYSLGGEFGAFALLAQPETFSNYILGSPSVSQREITYFDQLESTTAPQQQMIATNVFISVGELEENSIPDISDLVSVLRRRSEAGLALTGLEVIEGSDHTTAFPDTAIRGVKWLVQMRSNEPSDH
jgi:predicted alpha/beta superfamily hydrolase